MDGKLDRGITYFADHLVVLEHAPGDIDAVVVPVGPRHVLVNIGIDTRHGARLPSPTIEKGMRSGHEKRDRATTEQKSWRGKRDSTDGCPATTVV